MYITCLDVEGVLVPEIWIAFAEASGIPELKKTTRDEPDYDKLMNWRLGILKEHGLGLKEIQETIAKIDPLPAFPIRARRAAAVLPDRLPAERDEKLFFCEFILSFRILGLSLCALKTIRAFVRGVAQSG